MKQGFIAVYVYNSKHDFLSIFCPQNTVRGLLHEKIRDSYVHPQFIADVIKPLQIENIMDQEVIINCLIIISFKSLANTF